MTAVRESDRARVANGELLWKTAIACRVCIATDYTAIAETPDLGAQFLRACKKAGWREEAMIRIMIDLLHDEIAAGHRLDDASLEVAIEAAALLVASIKPN